MRGSQKSMNDNLIKSVVSLPFPSLFTKNRQKHDQKPLLTARRCCAVHAAQEYTWRTLVNGFRPGMGQHLPDRFFFLREHNAATADRESDDDA